MKTTIIFIRVAFVVAFTLTATAQTGDAPNSSTLFSNVCIFDRKKGELSAYTNLVAGRRGDRHAAAASLTVRDEGSPAFSLKHAIDETSLSDRASIHPAP